MSGKQQKKPAAVNVVPLPRSKKRSKENRPYEILDSLIRDFHPELRENKTNFVICWWFNWTADTDGNVQLGVVKKPSIVEKEILHKMGHIPVDFVILLNHEIWNAEGNTNETQKYTIDNCLEQCRPRVGKDGKVVKDENGRVVYRKRPAPISVFPSVYRRHGCAIESLQELARAVADRADEDRPLFDKLEDDSFNPLSLSDATKEAEDPAEAPEAATA